MYTVEACADGREAGAQSRAPDQGRAAALKEVIASCFAAGSVRLRCACQCSAPSTLRLHIDNARSARKLRLLGKHEANLKPFGSGKIQWREASRNAAHSLGEMKVAHAWPLPWAGRESLAACAAVLLFSRSQETAAFCHCAATRAAKEAIRNDRSSHYLRHALQGCLPPVR